MTRRLVLMIALASLLAACRAATPPAPGDEQPAPVGATPSGSPGSSPSPDPTSDPDGPSSTLGASPTPGTAPPATFATIGSVDDRKGDGGTEARAYNDILGIRIQDDGTNARVLVKLGATIPNPMPEGEQMGIGVDLYRQAGQDESDFQVFAAGTDTGWEAFLETPDGFVKYEWRFAIGGDLMEFTLPWSALGNMTGTRFRAFLDWDRDTIAIALAGQDRAPDDGRARFSR